MKKTIMLGLICLLTLATIVSAETLGDDGLLQKLESYMTFNDVIWTATTNYAIANPDFGRGYLADYRLTDGTTDNLWLNCLLDYDKIICNNFGIPYFEVTSNSFQYNGFDVCTSSGNCNAESSVVGWSGVCPADYKLIVKNGLVTGCKKPKR